MQHLRLFFAIATFTSFFLGVALHAWGRASSSVNSSLNGITSYQQYLRIYLPALCIRFFACTLILMAWSHADGSTFADVAAYIPALGWLAKHPLPLNPISAGVFGLCCDYILDLVLSKVPGLQKEIPPAPGLNGASKVKS
jgi:hypothetical protein